jgi:hypothetical protein
MNRYLTELAREIALLTEILEGSAVMFTNRLGPDEPLMIHTPTARVRIQVSDDDFPEIVITLPKDLGL